MRDAQQQLDLNSDSLRRKLKQFVADARAALSTRAQSLKTHDPKRELTVCKTRIADLDRRITRQVPRLMDKARQRFQTAEGILRVVSPEATLHRGYSITTDATGKVIRSVADAKPKSKVRTRVTNGEFESQVLPL
jgi:exodeoxyribonuclease VII large subunit